MRRLARGETVVGLSLAVLLVFQWQFIPTPSQKQPHAVRALAYAAETAAPRADRESIQRLLATDPLAALEAARAHHRDTVRDYTCTFVKQELLYNGMSKEQTIEVKFRLDPYSVVMHWVRNADKATRVIYVAGRWIDPEAENPAERELAVCQPGAIAKLFVPSIKQAIRGPRAREASRRFIDDFGFDKALDLMIEFSRLAASRGELKLWLEGESSFDGRPTWVLRRELLAAGVDRPYPDAAAVYQIDQEWLVPVQVLSYGDRGRQELLGRYEYRNVRMNSGCTQADFDPATYGM